MNKKQKRRFFSQMKIKTQEILINFDFAKKNIEFFLFILKFLC